LKYNYVMKQIRVSKEFHFEMAHALWHYDGLCKHIHGHSYKLFITIIGEPNMDSGDPKFGMVLDFADLKAAVKEPIVDYFDHALVVYREAVKDLPEHSTEMFDKVHVFEFQPTCENLVLYIVEKIRPALSTMVKLHSVRLYETATSFAEWHAKDNK